MNKKQAKDEAIENKRTWGELLALVDSSSGAGMSRVNKSLTKTQAIEIFKGALSKRNPDDYPKTLVPHRTQERMTFGGDGLTVINILREFA